jgi:hypothetical protein
MLTRVPAALEIGLSRCDMFHLLNGKTGAFFIVFWNLKAGKWLKSGM